MREEDFRVEPERFLRPPEDFLRPELLRLELLFLLELLFFDFFFLPFCLLTVAAAICLARLVERPRLLALFLMCSYWRSSLLDQDCCGIS